MVRISDARMSGTAFGTIVLHITPESADGGPLALVQTGDSICLDVEQRRIDLLVSDAELATAQGCLAGTGRASMGRTRLRAPVLSDRIAGGRGLRFRLYAVAHPCIAASIFHCRAHWPKASARSSLPCEVMIRLENISKQNGHQILFIEASATLLKGDKVGLVGPNGAGKTTLFRMITGQEEPDEGQVAIDRGVTIGYFNQDVGEMSGRSAVAEVMDGAGPVSAVAAELKELEAAMGDPARMDDMDAIVARYGEVQGRFEELDGYALEGRAREVLAGLSFSQEMMDNDVGALSGGWKMRVALARILLMRPDAMLLDEPSNHLDLESLIWLEHFLKAYEGALLMTSHDREFMNRIVTKIVEIDGGTLTTYSGDHEFYEQQRALNEKQQQAQFDRQQAMLAKEIKFIERFKARASHAAQVQSRVKQLEKIERVEPPKRRQTIAFDFPPAPRSGDDVVALKNVHKGYGARRIYDGLDFQVRRKERWCVMGVNGAGKSTLLKLIAGAAEPDKGAVTVGGSVKMGYFAQHAMELLDGESTVFETLEHAFPQAGQGSLRASGRLFRFFRR